MAKELLSLHNINKSFDGVKALTNVDLSLNEGEVHCIVGENGAGKSTLMKIIAGVLHPDVGEIVYTGKKIVFNSPREAADLGISIVFQEPMFFPYLSVLENIYLGDELVGRLRIIDWNRMADNAVEDLAVMGLPADILSKPMSALSIGTQQLVLIARGIHRKSALLILDEPTSILSNAETEILFKAIRSLRNQGVSVLYISHRMDDILEIGERISVLRDGHLVAKFDHRAASHNNLIEAMSGRKLASVDEWTRPLISVSPLLEVNELSSNGSFDKVTFSLHCGEVLGIYGLVGAGRTEVANAIIGESKIDSGNIVLEGRVIKPRGSGDAMRLGITYVPEDRRLQGLFPNRVVRDNISAGLFHKFSGMLGIINSSAEAEIAGRQIAELNIRTESQFANISKLSGGSQQKVMLSRGLLHQPKVLILDEPTRGIDIGTKAEIHRLVRTLSSQDVGIILVSSDLPEILALSDRILIMREGRIAGHYLREVATETDILKLALGVDSKKTISQV